MVSLIDRFPVINQRLPGKPYLLHSRYHAEIQLCLTNTVPGLKASLASEGASVHPHLSLFSEAVHIINPLLFISIADLFRFVPVILFRFPFGHTVLVILLLLVS